mgnify:FL=1
MTTIQEAMNLAMREIGAVGKDSYNETQRFNFRGIDAVINAVAPVFRQHGIIPTVKVVDVTYGEVTTARGSIMTSVRLLATYTFTGPAGDSMSSTVAAESFDSGDKATAKAMSVAYRTALLQTLCLPTDEPDPDHFTYERVQPEPVVAPGITTLAAKLRQIGDQAARKEYVCNVLGMTVDSLGSLKDLTEDQINAVLTALDTK